jgi:hypothetical protein
VRGILSTLLVLLAGLLHAQTPSVLYSGTWYKLSVSEDGIYFLDRAAFQAMGFNVGQLDPRKIQIYTGTIGMLPQSIATPRVSRLVQVTCGATGFDDGHFDTGDFIRFFANGPDRSGIDPATGKAFYENHLYSNKNYYFVTVGTASGLRVSTRASAVGASTDVTQYDDLSHYESELTNELRSGRKWYGERFDATLEYTVRFPFSQVIPGSTIQLITGAMGRSTSASSFQFLVNGVSVDNQSVPTISNIPYSVIGKEVQDTIAVDANAVSAPSRSNQDVTVRFTKGTGEVSFGYLDYLLMHVKRAPFADRVFRSVQSLGQAVSRYHFPPAGDFIVWDVTDPIVPIQQALISEPDGSRSFAVESTVLHSFIAFAQAGRSPVLEGVVPNQNLAGIGATDLLIVTAPEFQAEAERLAGHRSSHSGQDVKVVTTTQVYNEFSGGKQDVTAIRDFAKYIYDVGLKNLLLFGRGSYDYKDFLSFNKNFVPTYQSRNSLDPLATYASDDYFGFLENTEGNWGESPPEAHTLDIGVGRIPAKKVEEAAIWVDKLIAYESGNRGPWRKRILFVADDGDNNLHQSQADQLATTMETGQPEMEVRKLYLDDYPQSTGTGGQSSSGARKALDQAVNDGTAIINFTGHGSELQWMQERVLDQLSFDSWNPHNRYPFLITATCEFGRSDDPGLISSAELSLFRKNSGSIGLVTTSRPVYASTNFALNTALHQSLFTRSSGLIQDWGSVFRLTKNNSMSGVQNRNFSLLGDPSLLPPIGSYEVVVDNVTNLTSGSDTLKALSRVRVTGHVGFQGVMDASYQGMVQVTLFDKLTALTTLGDENPPFAFTLRDNALFRGQASVTDGQFEAEFIVPESIDQTVGTGQFSMYAWSTSGQQDALGALAPVEVGSLELDPGADDTGPDIEPFMGDTTFISGGLVGTSSRIIAILSDDNGIDISSYNTVTDIQAILDDTLMIVLNDYYRADVDTYMRGKVDYPIDGLLPGRHTLQLKATDTFGNESTASLIFYVTDAPGIQIEQWLNYPNPFSESTVFHFKHSRPGEDLEAAVTVFDRMGKVVLYNTYQVAGSTYKVDLPPWDGATVDGNKLPGGLYLMKLSVRSLLDGSKNERIAKVILLN